MARKRMTVGVLDFMLYGNAKKGLIAIANKFIILLLWNFFQLKSTNLYNRKNNTNGMVKTAA